MGAFEIIFRNGKAEGRKEGKAEGRKEGKAEGKAEALLLILERRGLAIDDARKAQVRAISDLRLLDRWLDRAFVATSADEVWSEP